MKKLIMTIAIATLMAVPATAQVFLDDEDLNNRENGASTIEGLGVMVPEQNVTYDQYVPVGEGILLLAGLAGAYLVGKRKKED
jgi:hypothetical protein